MPKALLGLVDIIIWNVRALCMDFANPTAQAIALQGELILAVGLASEISDLIGPRIQVIDGAGGTLLPGFVESHCHLFLGGSELGNLDLTKLDQGQDIVAAIRNFAEARPKRALQMVQGVDYAMLSEGNPCMLLDQMLSDRARALMSGDHRTVWANTAALCDCGLLHGGIASTGSKIVMGSDGLATGELREPDAFAAILKRAGQDRATLGLSTGGEPDPVPSETDRAADRDMLRATAHHLAAQGITSAVNMDGNLYTLSLLSELDDQGDLPIRVQVAFHFKPNMALSDLDKASAMNRDWQGDWLRSGLVKLFMDGVSDSRTAFFAARLPRQAGQSGRTAFFSQPLRGGSDRS